MDARRRILQEACKGGFACDASHLAQMRIDQARDFFASLQPGDEVLLCADLLDDPAQARPWRDLAIAAGARLSEFSCLSGPAQGPAALASPAPETALQELFARCLDDFPRPSDMGFANGRGYIQHDPAMMEELFFGLVEITKKFAPAAGSVFEKRSADIQANGIASLPFCARFGYECGVPAIENAWSRLYCIDLALAREWGQPAFANGMSKQGPDTSEAPLNPGSFAKKEKKILRGCAGPAADAARKPNL